MISKFFYHFCSCIHKSQVIWNKNRPHYLAFELELDDVRIWAVMILNMATTVWSFTSFASLFKNKNTENMKYF